MRRPNLILITADQQRADYIGCYGNRARPTPHLDLVASEGMVFTDAYSTAPICKPARTTIITGRQAHTLGAARYSDDLVLDLVRPALLGTLMTTAGYQTEVIGKTHWYLQPGDRAGFEHVTTLAALERARQAATGRRGSLHGIGYNEMGVALSHFPPGLHSTDWIVDKAIDFLIDRDRTVPFFLWLSFTDPHPPLVIHEPYFSLYRDELFPEPAMPDWIGTEAEPNYLRGHRQVFGTRHATPQQIKRSKSVYMGMVTNIDAQLGRFFGELQANKLWDSSALIYTADHGDHLGDFGDSHKASFAEPVTRVPMIWRLPPSMQQQRGHSSALVDLSDLLPTFCQLAQTGIPGQLDGRSLVPILEGETATVHEVLHGQINCAYMVRFGTYKYLFFSDDGRELLFDVSTDRLDMTNLSHDAEMLRIGRDLLIRRLEASHSNIVVDGALVGDPAREMIGGMAPTTRMGWPNHRSV